MTDISRESLLKGIVRTAELILHEGIEANKDAPGKAKTIMKAFRICVNEGYDIPKPILEWISNGFNQFINEGTPLETSFQLKEPRKESPRKEARFMYFVDLVWQESEAPDVTTVCKYLSGENSDIPEQAQPWVNMFREHFGITAADSIYRRYTRIKKDPPSELDCLLKFVDFDK